MRFLNVKAGGFWCTCFNPEGTLLASGHSDGIIRLWDTRTGKQSTIVNQNGPPPFDVAFSPNGKLFASSTMNGSVNFWRLSQQEDQVELVEGWTESKSPSKPMSTNHLGCFPVRLTFTPDGNRLFVGSTRMVSQLIIMGDLSERGLQTILVPEGTASPLRFVSSSMDTYTRTIAYSPDCTLIGIMIYYPRTTVAIGEISQNEVALKYQLPHRTDVIRIIFTPDKRHLATIAARTLRYWDIGNEKCLWEQTASKRNLLALDISPDGRTIATSGNDREVTFWDAETGREKQRFTFNVGKIKRVLFSPDGLTATAGGTSRKMVLWDVDG